MCKGSSSCCIVLRLTYLPQCSVQFRQGLPATVPVFTSKEVQLVLGDGNSEPCSHPFTSVYVKTAELGAHSCTKQMELRRHLISLGHSQNLFRAAG